MRDLIISNKALNKLFENGLPHLYNRTRNFPLPLAFQIAGATPSMNQTSPKHVLDETSRVGIGESSRLDYQAVIAEFISRVARLDSRICFVAIRES